MTVPPPEQPTPESIVRQMVRNEDIFRGMNYEGLFDAALKDAREAVVERIRRSLTDFYCRSDSSAENHPGVFAILDAVATDTPEEPQP